MLFKRGQWGSVRSCLLVAMLSVKVVLKRGQEEVEALESSVDRDVEGTQQWAPFLEHLARRLGAEIEPSIVDEVDKSLFFQVS